ncbi:MAG: DinB family protein [Acidimicrobiales bacterium]
MAEQFEFQDLSDAVFWGVDLRGASFRDVDLAGARITHARLTDVAIDAVIERLVVNGVDVTTYVNERDGWFPLRTHVHPTEPDRMRDGWVVYLDAWNGVIERARSLTDPQRHTSIGGEWSFVQTLRHLVFGTDKWFTVPILGGTFHPMGLPNSGSADFGWPGIDNSVTPTFEEACAAWKKRWNRLGEYLGDVGPSALEAQVVVLENGATEVHDCIGVVFEEHFEHLRYAARDLDHLG